MTDDEPADDEPRCEHRDGEAARGAKTAEGARDAETVDWTQVPEDPHPDALGYETEQWDRIPTPENEQIIFLPSDGADLAKNAFVVLEESDLRDLAAVR